MPMTFLALIRISLERIALSVILSESICSLHALPGQGRIEPLIEPLRVAVYEFGVLGYRIRHVRERLYYIGIKLHLDIWDQFVSDLVPRIIVFEVGAVGLVVESVDPAIFLDLARLRSKIGRTTPSSRLYLIPGARLGRFRA